MEKRNVKIGEILKDLEKDHIFIKEPNKEVLKISEKYYGSYLQQNIIATRYNDPEELVKYYNTKLTDILDINFLEERLPELKESYKPILDTINENKHILIVSDYDVDGVTSAVVSYLILTKLFKYNNVEVIINRREAGNGINKNLTDQIISYHKSKPIGLLFTSDHGSHDRENLTRIKDECEGIKVVVTDHHLFEEHEAPYNMDAFVNPQRTKGEFKDITGANVAYFTLIHALLKQNKVDIDVDYIYYLLTYVGLTIISDCMDLKSYVNRKILTKCIVDLNNNNIQHDPFWKFIIKEISDTYVIDETSLGYDVIPLLNTPGRIADPRLSFEFMIASDLDMAKEYYEDIKALNTKRKELQTKLVDKGKKEEYSNGIVKVMAIENSDGVQGIIANNAMYNDNYKVVIVFTKKNINGDVIYIGSGRSQDENLSIKEVIDKIADSTDFIISHGGHDKAIGIKMKPKLKEFYKLLCKEIESREVKKIENIYVEDFIFSNKKLLLNLFDVAEIGPYGIGYDKPLFVSDFYIDNYRIYKRSGYYLSFKVKLYPDSSTVFNVFYNIKKADIEYFEDQLKKCKKVRMVYSLNISTYKNYNKILLQPTNIIFKCDD